MEKYYIYNFTFTIKIYIFLALPSSAVLKPAKAGLVYFYSIEFEFKSALDFHSK